MNIIDNQPKAEGVRLADIGRGYEHRFLLWGDDEYVRGEECTAGNGTEKTWVRITRLSDGVVYAIDPDTSVLPVSEEIRTVPYGTWITLPEATEIANRIRERAERARALARLKEGEEVGKFLDDVELCERVMGDVYDALGLDEPHVRNVDQAIRDIGILVDENEALKSKLDAIHKIVGTTPA